MNFKLFIVTLEFIYTNILKQTKFIMSMSVTNLDILKAKI